MRIPSGIYDDRTYEYVIEYTGKRYTDYAKGHILKRLFRDGVGTIISWKEIK